jgi:hypothetical protein
VATTFRWAVIALLVAHGLIHLLGAAKGFGWAEVTALKEPIGTAAACGWLLASGLVLATAVMLVVRGPAWWWAVAAAAALVSQALVLTSWTDARAGTIVNVLLVLVAVLGFAASGPSSFAAEWDHRTREALRAESAPVGIVEEADLAGLPDAVSRYLRRSGAVGHPHVRSFFAEVHGRIRGGPDEPWMTFSGRQLNTYGDVPRRIFHIDATMRGLPVTVLHVFDDRGATMRGKVLSLLPILDAKGPTMDRSETVTLLNDMVVLAPAALVDAPVQWAELSPTRVGATYTRGDQTVSAVLVFDAAGDLVDFISQDRSRASRDGGSFTRMPWNTPISRYAVLHGRRVAVEGTAQWDAPAPEGHFPYIEFVVDDLAYDVTTPAVPAEVDRLPRTIDAEEKDPTAQR